MLVKHSVEGMGQQPHLRDGGVMQVFGEEQNVVFQSDRHLPPL